MSRPCSLPSVRKYAGCEMNQSLGIDNRFPEPLEARLSHRFGPAIAIESLRGLTDASVWRVRFVDVSVIVKQTTRANEAFFYAQVAPVLRADGIPIPELLHLDREASVVCLVLEDIPLPFPRECWLADEEQLTILRRLHNIDGCAWQTGLTLYRPAWPAEMTDAALTWFPASIAGEIRAQLEEWRLEALPLFEPSCLISGDPNPLNWGTRHDGTLVHFDWERFGWGTPALDLAITVPGLGTIEDYQIVTAKYLQSAKGAEVENLAKELRLAKMWTIVELLSNFHSNGQANEAILAHLVVEFPKWLNCKICVTNNNMAL